jgi:hypothetical protein
MMSMEEMFYGPKEDVWIVKPEKKEEVKKGETPPKPPPPTALEESFGTYYPYYHPPYTPPTAAATPKKTPDTKNVDFKIPICCSQCTDGLTASLLDFKGVQKVTCNIGREKVTVAVKNDVNIDEVLLECRKVFKKSRMWTKDD